jgi:hypothetical protein
LYEACKEAKAKDSDIRQQVRRIGNQFVSHVEIGAQEAAYLVLQMPLRRSSRDVVFIDSTLFICFPFLLRNTGSNHDTKSA